MARGQAEHDEIAGSKRAADAIHRTGLPARRQLTSPHCARRVTDLQFPGRRPFLRY